MSEQNVYLAVDLGASSGRVMAGIHEDDAIALRQVHRFSTPWVNLNGSYHWDILGLYQHILDGLREAATVFGDQVAGIGVDTWGVDYGLLDGGGRLLGNPFQYRDPRTDRSMPEAVAKLSRERIFGETGIQFLPFNTIYQLYAEVLESTGAIGTARSMLFLPDLLTYWLCGEQVQERTIASTSQLWNPVSGNWSDALIGELGIPRHIFMPVIEPGTLLKPVTEHIQAETSLGPVPVIAVAGHDTGSAVAGAPLDRGNPAFMSSGTWSLMGMEVDEPIIAEDVLANGFSNEAGVEGTTRFLKNICGMWLIEQLRAEWRREGREYGYDELVEEAKAEPAFRSIIDPDADRFAKPGEMSEKIRSYCEETGQPAPESRGALVRCALESLAAKYAIVYERLKALSPVALKQLRIVGGGSQNRFLNQCTADALGVEVVAGPVEATSLGNLIMQMKATGRIGSLEEGRALVAHSFEEETYRPGAGESWHGVIERLRGYLET